MKKTTLIQLDRPGRLLKKAWDYLTDMEAFLGNTSRAVTVLLDALPNADTELMLKIIPLLGYAGKDRALWPLYHLMIAASNNEQVCCSIAVQLGLAASLSDDSAALKAELIKNLSHPDPSVRSSCALALGWEGNWPAVKSLMAHLSDPDQDVQTAVVAALSSVGDVRVFDILTARLETADVDEQRNILLNLWRFTDQIPRIEALYLGCMDNIPPDLLLDVLCALGMIPLSKSILECYRRLLADEDPHIRRQVLENLSAVDPADYTDDDPLKAILRLLLDDKNARVRQSAIRLFTMK